MSIKKYMLGFIVVGGIAFMLPKPEAEKQMGFSIEDKLGNNPVVEQQEDRQTFDEYASNTIRHFVETGSDTPSPWYDPETLEDNAFYNGYSGDSPWEKAD